MGLMRYVFLSQLAIAVLYVVYKCVLSRDSFLRMHRIVAWSGALFAFVYPLLQGLYQPVLQDWMPTEEFAVALPAVTALANSPAEETEVLTIVGCVYVVGVFLGCGCLAMRLLSLAAMYRQSHRGMVGGVDVRIISRKTVPFSFFKAIFIPEQMCSSEALHDILLHEQAHVRQVHTLDVLLGESIVIAGWINPFAWLLRREIRLYTEFLADAEVVHRTDSPKAYQYHLLQVSGNRLRAFGVPFSRHSLRQRIRMMNRGGSHPICAAGYLLLLPVAAALIFASQACNTVTKENQAADRAEKTGGIEPVVQGENRYDRCEEMPEFPGGEIALFGFIQDNLRYPAAAMADSVQGRVIVQFVVDATGQIVSPKIVRSLSAECDAEVLRVVRLMPKWTPGKHEGKNVDVRYTLPVAFSLH